MGQQKQVQSIAINQIGTEHSVSLASVQGVEHHRTTMCTSLVHGCRLGRIIRTHAKLYITPHDWTVMLLDITLDRFSSFEYNIYSCASFESRKILAFSY